jgi:DNA-binding CsgD family transcriptional regulator
MRAQGSALIQAVGHVLADQAHTALRSLEIFGVAFLCYDADGRRIFASRPAAELLDSGAISEAAASRLDRIVAQQLATPKPSLQLGRFALTREISVNPAPATIGIYVARPALEDVAVVVVIRPQLPMQSQNLNLGILSDREQRVAQLISAGLSAKEIASRLGISPHTARHHTEHVFAKLGVRSRAAVAALCAAG